MKVTYIYHSGFSVELERCVLLFDYYMGELPDWDRKKTVYVFVSHKHKDHFNLNVFNLADKYDHIIFFLGSDVKLSERYLERNHIETGIKEKIINVGKNKKLLFDEIEIATLRSTDAGVAYIVNVEGTCVYHAGDLNWWHWEGEPYPFNETMEKDYKREIGRIQGMHFHIAFVPLDPRLEKAYGFGMDYYLEHVKADVVFPMHMWDEYGYIGKYKQTAIGAKYKNRIQDIAAPGQEFDLWNI